MKDAAPITVVAFIVQYAVGIILLYAAVVKFREREVFDMTLRGLGIPPRLRSSVLLGVPGVEAATGAALVSGVSPFVAGLASTAVAGALVLVSIYALTLSTPSIM